MPASSPHNKIIRSIAGAKLRPMGIQQKGRSRFWYDDRRWHAISIEFQPSGFEKGSYLNVAISWVWYPKDHWSFDLPHLPRPWVGFQNEEQFEQDFAALVNVSIKSISELRDSYRTLHNAYKNALQAHMDLARRGGPPDVNLGLLAALNGEFEQAENLLGFVAKEEAKFEADTKRKAFCERAISRLGSVEDMRSWIEENIAKGRGLLGLPQLELPTLPDH